MLVVAVKFDKPEGTARSSSDIERVEARSKQREFADRASEGDTPYLTVLCVAISFTKPEVVVRPFSNTVQLSVWSRQRELVDASCSAHAPDLVALPFGARRIR